MNQVDKKYSIIYESIHYLKKSVSGVKSYHLLPMSSTASHFCPQSIAVIYCNSPGSEIFTKKDPKSMT